MESKNEFNLVKRNYKDTVFRRLFNDKTDLLSLYNAVNGSTYSQTDDLRINTLDNAIYMSFKNDISFVFGFELNIYEHQSTINPNMPLRNLFYVSRLLEKEISTQRTLYSSVQIKIPTPRFIVFYNGEEQSPSRKELKLSNLFELYEDNPQLELQVTMININWGENRELMERCQALKEYAQYIDKVRTYAKHMDIREAVNTSVEECIKQGILRQFLLENRAEVVQMSIFEYDEEKELKLIREAERSFGYKTGLEQGLDQGEIKQIVMQVRVKHQKRLSTSDIADILETNELLVHEIVEIIECSPALNDTDVAIKILNNRNSKS